LAVGSLDEVYQRLEDRYVIEVSDDLGALLMPNGNGQARVHRWFHMKEGYSCRLLSRVLEDVGLLGRKQLVLADPFVGAGTTVISASDHGLATGSSIEAVGVEQNPFLALLAQTRACAVQEPPNDFDALFDEVVGRVELENVSPAPVPDLSTFKNPKYIDPRQLRELLMIRQAVEESNASRLSKSLALIALGATIEPVSSLRRDGRALRYENGKTRTGALDEFSRRAKLLAEDVSDRVVSDSVSLQVVRGDGRRVADLLPHMRDRCDLVLFSPPYLNNIDYTEVYKLEAWLLGLFATR
jgi:hypothetical protein